MGWYNDFDYGYHGFGMVLVMLLFWLPLIGLGIWLVARVTRSTPAASAPTVAEAVHPTDSARGILDRRFASGELSAEQYAEMRRVLETGGGK